MKSTKELLSKVDWDKVDGVIVIILNKDGTLSTEMNETSVQKFCTMAQAFNVMAHDRIRSVMFKK